MRVRKKYRQGQSADLTDPANRWNRTRQRWRRRRRSSNRCRGGIGVKYGLGNNNLRSLILLSSRITLIFTRRQSLAMFGETRVRSSEGPDSLTLPDFNQMPPCSTNWRDNSQREIMPLYLSHRQRWWMDLIDGTQSFDKADESPISRLILKSANFAQDRSRRTL